MEYKIETQQFEGPLDLLLHLIKQENINIQDVCIDEITNQYLIYINKMEEMNLNIASEYLVMAAELLEIKSSSLLPKSEEKDEEDIEDPRENLIKKLIEYEQYKNITSDLKKMEEYRKEIFTRDPQNLFEYSDNDNNIDLGVNLDDLLNAFSNLIKQKEAKKTLDTKITNKEYNIKKRCDEIKKYLKTKSKISFKDLFETFSKQYVAVTFLAILSMSKNQEIQIEQESNFKDIIIKGKGDFNGI